MTNYVIFIVGGSRDGEVLMETKNLDTALRFARSAEKTMILHEDETIGLDGGSEYFDW